MDTLLKYGYEGQYMSENWLKQPLFIQSFAPTSIIHVSNLIDSPKVFLIDDISVRTQDTNQVLMFCNNLSAIYSIAMNEKQSGYQKSNPEIFRVSFVQLSGTCIWMFLMSFLICSHTGKSLQMTTFHTLENTLSALVHGKILLFQLQETT